jgi:autotransporter family porin
MPPQSFGEAELLIAMIEAFGAPRPTSFGLGELQDALALAITTGGGSGVTSFNGRTGVVVPTTGDYTAAQVTNAADKSSASTQVFTAAVQALAHTATLTGSSGRFVGATTGSPTGGPYLRDDYAVDASVPTFWICTAGGSPGTWAEIAAGGSGTVTNVSSANGNLTVATPTTTPVLTVVNSPSVGGITVSGTPSSGQVLTATSASAADWAPSTGSITLIESTGGSISVTGGSGPTTNLAVVNSPAVGGVTVTGTPTSGQALVATSSTAADWQTAAAAPPFSNFTTVTANVNPAVTGTVYLVNGTGAISVTLPTSISAGAVIAVARGSNTSTITILAGGSNSINARSSITMSDTSAQTDSGMIYLIATSTTTWQVIAAANTDFGLNMNVSGIMSSALIQNSGLFQSTGEVMWGVNPQTSVYSVTGSDFWIPCNGTFTVTLPPASVVNEGRMVIISNGGAGTITVASGGGTVDLTTLPANSGAIYMTDGTNWPAISSYNTGGTGSVSSVANSDGTLTISPTTGAVIASRPAITGDTTIAAGSNVSHTVAVNGTSVPATPSTGQVLTATSGTTATWQTPSTGYARSINTVSSNTSAGSAANTDYVYFSSGTVTITLPTAVGNTNFYTIKNTGTNSVSIGTTSSQLIDGSAGPLVITTQNQSYTLISDNSNWQIV